MSNSLVALLLEKSSISLSDCSLNWLVGKTGLVAGGSIKSLFSICERDCLSSVMFILETVEWGDRFFSLTGSCLYWHTSSMSMETIGPMCL